MAPRSLRLVPHFLLAALVAAFVASAGFTLATLLDYRRHEDADHRAGGWTASETAMEYLRLLDALDRVRAGDAEIDAAAVRLHRDRLRDLLPELLGGARTAAVRAVPGVTATAADLLDALGRLDAGFAALDGDARAAAGALRRALDPFGPPVQRMVQAVMLVERAEAAEHQAMRELILLSLIGTLAVGALLVWRLAAEVGRGRRLRRVALSEGHRAKVTESQLQDALQSMSEAFALFDADDRLVLCNRRYRRLYGPEARHVRPGVRFEELMRFWVRAGRNRPGDDDDAWVAERLRRHRQPQSTHERQIADGRWLLVRERRTADGGIVAVVLDMTGLRREQDALERSRTRLRRLTEISATGVLIGDRDGGVAYANATLLALLGYDEDDLRCRRLDWRRLTAPGYEEVDRRTLRELSRRGRCTPHRRDLVTRDGRRVPVWVGAAVLDRGPGGELVGAAFVTDLTELERAEAALLVSEERLRLALEGSGLGTWDYHPATGDMVWCERTRAIFGVPPGEPIDHALFLSLVHPGDRERVDAQASRALDPDGDGVYEAEYRVRLPDGGVRWVSARGSAVFAGEGGERRAVRLLGTHLDVTERRRAEIEFARMAAAVQESNERARLATESVGLGTWDADLIAGTAVWSPRCREIYGVDPVGEVTDALFLGAVHADDRPAVETAIRTAFDPEGTGAYGAEFRVVRPDGSVRWVAARGTALFAEIDGTRRAERFLGTMMDVTARRQAEERLKASLAEKETLLREVHHRVKNNLQAIWGLLQVEALRLADLPRARERLEAIGQRIHVLGRIHQQLYASPDVARIDLADHLGELCRGLDALHRGGAEADLRVEAESVCCDLDTALPLGLIANELVSNALKHAFPGGRAGTVQVTLRRTAGGDVELTVADDGVGTAAAGGGIGAMLVDALAQQIGAAVTVATARGRTVRVAVPGARFPTPESPRPDPDQVAAA